MRHKVIFGDDLSLGFVADEEGRVFVDPFRFVDLQVERRSDVVPAADDIGVVSGRGNLVQALIMRLKTGRGELAALGHPDYGSRHHKYVGELNNENNRNLVKLYVLECLKQEQRLEEILSIEVKPGEGAENRDKVDLSIRVKAKGDPEPLNFIVPFSFGGSES